MNERLAWRGSLAAFCVLVSACSGKVNIGNTGQDSLPVDDGAPENKAYGSRITVPTDLCTENDTGHLGTEALSVRGQGNDILIEDDEAPRRCNQAMEMRATVAGNTISAFSLPVQLTGGQVARCDCSSTPIKGVVKGLADGTYTVTLKRVTDAYASASQVIDVGTATVTVPSSSIPAPLDCLSYQGCGVDQPQCPAGTSCLATRLCSQPICISSHDACVAQCGTETGCAILDSFPGQIACPSNNGP